MDPPKKVCRTHCNFSSNIANLLCLNPFFQQFLFKDFFLIKKKHYSFKDFSLDTVLFSFEFVLFLNEKKNHNMCFLIEFRDTELEEEYSFQ